MNENYYHKISHLEAILLDFSEIINQFLANNIASIVQKESNFIKEVYKPILYSLLNGGKRIRPIVFLLVSGFEKNLSQQEIDEFLYTANSIELIHTYSLIHDDLPAMDNDDFRRGIPTCHKKFPEWAAILAGDSLNTLAFYLLSLTNFCVKEKIQILAKYGGISGMILGQALDLSHEKKDFVEPTKNFSSYEDFFKLKGYYKYFKQLALDTKKEEFFQLLMIHYHKTAALFRATIELAIITGKIKENRLFDDRIYQSYIEYGEILGLLFQISDDILDEIGDEKSLGKKTKKDKELGKLTFPMLLGIEKSLEFEKTLAEYCSNLVSNFLIAYTNKDYRDILKTLPYYIINRNK